MWPTTHLYLFSEPEHLKFYFRKIFSNEMWNKQKNKLMPENYSSCLEDYETIINAFL